MPAHAPLVLGNIGAAGTVRAQIAADSPHTEGTALVGIASHALGFVPVPDGVHGILFQPVIYSTYGLVIGNSFFLHGNSSFCWALLCKPKCTARMKHSVNEGNAPTPCEFCA